MTDALQEQQVSVPLSQQGHLWACRVKPGTLKAGDWYQAIITAGDGQRLSRRDPYARSTDYGSNWCTVDDAEAFAWSQDQWQAPAFDSYMIYEMHVGSFTPEVCGR